MTFLFVGYVLLVTLSVLAELGCQRQSQQEKHFGTTFHGMKLASIGHQSQMLCSALVVCLAGPFNWLCSRWKSGLVRLLSLWLHNWLNTSTNLGRNKTKTHTVHSILNKGF